jgi:uncharacterized membrane protein (UPF0127 family)
MKIYFEILLIIIAVLAFSYLFFHSASVLLSPATPQSFENQVCFGSPPAGGCFSVELAKTDAERERGLMYRTQLAKNAGMLFIFDKEDIYPFWMKNTLIPLDMIWIKENPSAGSGQVVFISQNTMPCKSLICLAVMPTAKAKYVLEINAGLVEEIGLKLGDELKISLK